MFFIGGSRVGYAGLLVGIRFYLRGVALGFLHLIMWCASMGGLWVAIFSSGEELFYKGCVRACHEHQRDIGTRHQGNGETP